MTTEPDDLFNCMFEKGINSNQAAALTKSIWAKL
jgi:hypothetical protein